MTKLWVLILSLMLTALLFGSSDRAIDRIQEARIAQTAREMVVLNDWLVPHYNGELRLQKPPLTYWLTAASYKLFGVSELSARLPSALFSILTAWLLFVWCKKSLNLNVACNVVLILISTFIGLRYFRSGEADSVLIFFISLACYAGFLLFEKVSFKANGFEATLLNAAKKHSNHQPIIWLLMLALGLGFLTKGPAAIAIPLLTLAVYAFFIKQLPTLKYLLSPVGLTIFALTAFAWYAWILVMMPDIAQHFFSRQVDETFISGNHQQPIYWYLAHALDFFAPWSLLLIPAGIWCYKNRPLPKIVHFSIVWLAVVLVLLTLTVNKQTQYALLFLPPLVIILGYYLSVASGKFSQFNQVVFWLLCVAALVLIAVVMHRQGIAILFKPKFALLLALMLLPLLLKKALKISCSQWPMLIAATLTIFIYLFAEQYLTKEVGKSDIKMLMQTAKTKTPLYQALPGNGAVSFYAQRPIKPLNNQKLAALMVSQQPLWWVSKDKPVIDNIQVDAETQVGDWTLWKLTRLP